VADKERKVILLHEVIEQRLRKEKELEFYKQQLEEIQVKISFLDRELTLTNLIIDIIHGENVIDLFPNDRVESIEYEDKK
jgi:hypothetical protein